MICGLILAAGDGTRYDASSSKLLATLDGRPLLEWAVAAQCAVPAIDRVAVVLGAFAAEVQASVDLGRAQAIVCERWREGQAESLRCGAEFLLAGCGAGKVILTLGDQPLTAAVVARFVAEPAGARAVYGGRPGHPVVLGPEHLDAIRALDGDRGLRGLLDGPRIECSELYSGRDVDTPDDLEAIRREARAVI